MCHLKIVFLQITYIIIKKLLTKSNILKLIFKLEVKVEMHALKIVVVIYLYYLHDSITKTF